MLLCIHLSLQRELLQRLDAHFGVHWRSMSCCFTDCIDLRLRLRSECFVYCAAWVACTFGCTPIHSTSLGSTSVCCLQVLSVAADALGAQRRSDALRTVVSFADSLPAHVPQAIYRELNRALNRTLS